MTSKISSAASGNRLLLAISFAGPGGSLALADDARLIDEIAWEKKATASELATVRLAELLGRNRRGLRELTHLLVNHGPGSFTGIRVGLNLARTLAYALDLPIAPLDALTVLAHRFVRPGERRLIALKAVRNHFYAAEFSREPRALKCTLAPTSLARDDARLDATDVLIEGETPDFDPCPSARDLVNATLDLPQLATFFSWGHVKPLYVRGSEAEEKLRK